MHFALVMGDFDSPAVCLFLLISPRIPPPLYHDRAQIPASPQNQPSIKFCRNAAGGGDQSRTLRFARFARLLATLLVCPARGSHISSGSHDRKIWPTTSDAALCLPVRFPFVETPGGLSTGSLLDQLDGSFFFSLPCLPIFRPRGGMGKAKRCPPCLDVRQRRRHLTILFPSPHLAFLQAYRGIGSASDGAREGKLNHFSTDHNTPSQHGLPPFFLPGDLAVILASPRHWKPDQPPEKGRGPVPAR